jgi:hypothetical protein
LAEKLAEPLLDPPDSWLNHHIERRLSTLSGPSLPVTIESFRALVKMFGLSGASPHQVLGAPGIVGVEFRASLSSIHED